MLQDAVIGFSFEEVRQIIEQDLGEKIETSFASFDIKPLASASIAQVHRATLHTGEDVVIKVQRPDIADIIEIDLQILSELAEIAENNFPQIARYEPIALIKSLKRSMNRELNFLLETRIPREQFQQVEKQIEAFRIAAEEAQKESLHATRALSAERQCRLEEMQQNDENS
jgi:predicted unusual protein kinase regulating ubiquinone biosynthesis (AarF/ABC1/UbiB family)